MLAYLDGAGGKQALPDNNNLEMNMSIADRIADQFGNDGVNWEDIDGVLIQDTIEKEAVEMLRIDGGKSIATFRDGSMMFLCDDWWDVVNIDDDGRFIDSNGDDVSPLT